jgi:hypothetical protein
MWNYNLSTEHTTMSKTAAATAEPSPPSFVIVEIVTGYTCPIKAFTATSADSLDHAMLHTTYKNAINLACTLHSSKNLTDWFAALVTETEHLMIQCNATIANCTTLTAPIVRLNTQLMLTLTLATTTTNPSPAGCKEQTNPEKFTREDCGKLRSFVPLLCLCLIDRCGEVMNKQFKLQYTFSRLE